MTSTPDYTRLRQALDYVKRFPGRAPAFAVIEAAAESTLPRTKTVDAWYVESAILLRGTWQPHIHTFTNKDGALAEYTIQISVPQTYSCVRVTGPHRYEVPA